MKTNIVLTFSKILSLLILLLAFLFSIYTKEAAAFIAAIPVSAGLVANKQYNDRKKEVK